MDILLIDDHKSIRDEMRSLLEEEGFRVVGEAETGEEGVDKAADLHPDLVIMDILLPGITGIEATKQICERDAGMRVLALSNHSDKNLVRAATAAGALGYVLKDHAFEELFPAIEAVARGESYFGEDLNGGDEA